MRWFYEELAGYRIAELESKVYFKNDVFQNLQFFSHLNNIQPSKCEKRGRIVIEDLRCSPIFSCL